jgi:hypothetical protein
MFKLTEFSTRMWPPQALPGNALRWRLPASLAARAQSLIAHPPAETLRNVKLPWFSEQVDFPQAAQAVAVVRPIG